MEMLTIARDKAPDCEPGEKITFSDVSGTVTHADDEAVMIKVESVGEKSYPEEEVEEAPAPVMSPAETAALGKGRRKKPMPALGEGEY